MSSWPRSTPCRAQVGSAWCMLCQLSPKLRIASGQKFAALVAGGERPLADHVADRVDRPGDVVQQRDPHQRGPEERGQRAGPGPGDQAAEHRRAASSETATRAGTAGRPARCPGRPAGPGANRSRLVCSRSNSQPDVRVARSPWPAPPVDVAVAPRRVRVALAVAEGVVAAVVGHPADDRALDRHRAGDRQRDAQPPVGLERAVGEVAGGSRR